jgi:2-oxoglutarate/2-oxoacid ferredoxin oxidoreductase subunit beta
MAVVYQRSKGLTDVEQHFCPGCTHGVIHKLVAEVLEELDIIGTTIGVASVGCSAFAYNYFACDMQQAAHGRAPAVATGIKRVHPDLAVFTYQGDGDLAAIGTAEIVHAAMRGEKITAIFVNNAIYGMTGGQMAPTTLIGQHGSPIRMAEMLATLDGCAYAERVMVADPASIAKAKRAIKKAFTLQLAGAGFTMVELLSTCPTNWGLSPVEAIGWLKENLVPCYPLGVYADRAEQKEEATR